jgi:hypothetical protein
VLLIEKNSPSAPPYSGACNYQRVTRSLDDSKIGDLLTRSGLLSKEGLDESLVLAERMRMPVGRVLVLNGFLSPDSLKSCIEIQSAIRDRILNDSEGLKAIKLVVSDKVDSQTAINRIRPSETKPLPRTHRLGEILIEAGFIDRTQLKSLLAQSEDTGLPLGRVLMITDSITEVQLYAALNIQKAVRRGVTDWEEGMEALKKVRSNTSIFSIPGSIFGEKASQMLELGEVLMHAELISKTELISLYEQELIQEKPLDEIIKQKELISPLCLQAARALVILVEFGLLHRKHAVPLLRFAHDDEQLEDVLEVFDRLKSYDVDSGRQVLLDALEALGVLDPASPVPSKEEYKTSPYDTW